MPSDLRRRLVDRISAVGPITVAEFMSTCLHDPDGGYYASRPRLGADGDFITAPHVSQMFGELIGLWTAEAWARLGRPSTFRLIEVGPGDGTLMVDALRAGRVAPGFLEAAQILLVETSLPLRQRQAEALSGVPVDWRSSLNEIEDDAPVILIANEFLDCLPIRQAVRVDDGWCERRIGLGIGETLMFVEAEPRPEIFHEAPSGAICEWSPDLVAAGAAIGGLIARSGGAALMVDYGRAEPGLGDTLQALRAHRKESPLAHPGCADLTAHVDFPAFLASAERSGARAMPLVSQGVFLRRLGVETRAATLSAAHPDQAAKVARQLERLTAADQMGDLFKVACLTSSGLDAP